MPAGGHLSLVCVCVPDALNGNRAGKMAGRSGAQSPNAYK